MADLEESVAAQQLGGFADVDRAGADAYVSRLDAMHALQSFQAYKGESFGRLGLGPGASVAEIGCGAGEDARRLAGLVAPGGRVVGFDASEAMVREARSRHGEVEGLSFVQGDAAALEAADGGFDAARADRVLLHVPDPDRVLAEMARITRPGGRIMACEPDMPACWVAADDMELSELVMRRIAHSCAHPYMARELWGRFRALGLKDLSLTVYPVTAFSPEAIEKTLHVQAVLQAMVAKGAVEPGRAAAWAADLAERGRTGRFVAGVSIMTVCGTKP